MPPEADLGELVGDVGVPVDDRASAAHFDVEARGRTHVKRDHAVVGVLAQRGRLQHLVLAHAVQRPAHLGHIVHLHHDVHAASLGREGGQRQAVVAAVGAVEEVDGHHRPAVTCRLEVEDVGQAKAHDLAGKGARGLEVGRGQHGVAHADVARDEARHADGGVEAGEVALEAPHHLVAVARRVLESHQGLHAACLAQGGVAALVGHAVGLQGLHGGIKVLRAADLPAGGRVGIARTPFHRDAELPLVHLDAQSIGRPGQGHHAQHVLGIGLPLCGLGGLRHHIRQSPDVHRLLPSAHCAVMRPARTPGACMFPAGAPGGIVLRD